MNEHRAFNSRKPVFVEVCAKKCKWLANDAKKIPVNELKTMLRELIDKLDKTGSTDRTSALSVVLGLRERTKTLRPFSA